MFCNYPKASGTTVLGIGLFIKGERGFQLVRIEILKTDIKN